MLEVRGNKDEGNHQEDTFPNGRPIEPEGRKIRRPSLLKWLFFLLAIIYILVSYYHAPILTRLGRYLIVEHPAQKSDLIVCLAGGIVDRGLAVAEAYQKGLAPRIFMSREEPPDGYVWLREKGVNYPENVDLMIMLLEGLGIPKSALLVSDRPAESTLEEAEIVKDVVEKGNYKSLLLITSPIHSRRAWLAFRKVFEKKDVRILVVPSPYSEFNPEDWWKKRRYQKRVIIEYEKLIYYTVKYLW